MKAITDTAATALEWKNPLAGGPRYELCAGEDVLAILELGHPATGGATVETVEGRWTLQPAGFLASSTLLREEGSDLDLAVFHPGLLGRGHLHFTNGVTFQWRHEGLGSAVWSFRGEGGELLVTLRLEPDRETGPGLHRVQAEVHVTPAGHFSPRVPLLAALGWYLILMHREEAVASGPMSPYF
jgi:hypothetical protein